MEPVARDGWWEVFSGALRGLGASAFTVYAHLAWRAGGPGSRVELPQEALALLTGLSRATVVRALRDIERRGLIVITPRPRPQVAAYQVIRPSQVGLSGVDRGLPDANRGVPIVSPIATWLSKEDLGTFRSITASFLPEDWQAYRRDALRLIALRWPGIEPTEELVEAVRDRLILREHFGPTRLARYQSELVGW